MSGQGQYQPNGNQRAGQGFIPPPPPPNVQNGGSTGLNIPPPPPRLPGNGIQTSTTWIPPPPSQPTTYWNANRQPSYSHPTQAVQSSTNREPQAYDPMAYEQYMSTPLSDDKPLTSATYIPGSDSFGPGVGIPPLHSFAARTAMDMNQQRSHYGADMSMQYQPHYMAGTHSNSDYMQWSSMSHMGTFYPPNPMPPPIQTQLPQQSSLTSSNFQSSTPSSIRHKKLVAPAKVIQEHQSPATEHSRHTFSSSTQPSHETSSNRDPLSSTEQTGSTLEQTWPRERVQIWLQAHGFSKEWQAAFEHLNVHGNAFVNIGRSAEARKLGFMPQVVLPQVMREATNNGLVYEQAQARQEASRLRRLVRDVINNGSTVGLPGSGTTANAALKHRRESTNNLSSAGPGTDSGAESSPNVSRQDFNPPTATPSTAGGGDESPLQALSNASGQPKFSTQRAATFDVPPTSNNDNVRPVTSAAASGSLADTRGRLSPNTVGDGSVSGRNAQSSPQHSPAQSNARPATSSSSRYYSHLRSISNESGKLATQDARERRNGQDAQRPQNINTAHRSSQDSSGLGSAKSLFGIFRPRGKKEEGHPSPDEDHSPISPNAARQIKHMHHSSETSVEDRPSSRASGQRSVDGGTARRRQMLDKKFVFVTPDGWNYRLIDITFVDSAEQMRTVICYNLGIQENADVTFHLTSPGQMEHEEGLSNSLLMSAKNRMADAVGGLKLFVLTPSYQLDPDSAGPGTEHPASPFGRISFTGRPLDADTYRRLTQPGPDSATATISSDARTLVGDTLRNLHNLDKREGSGQSGLPHDFVNLTEAERLALLDAKAEEHRQETKRKQEAYLAQRRNRISGTAGRVHDFDNPRGSPYEPARPLSSGSLDQSTRESLVPMRRAPPVPEPTTTLAKANSLTKKQSVNGRTSWPNRKEEPWKRASGGHIPEEAGGRPPSRGASILSARSGGSNRTPSTPSGLHKSISANADGGPRKPFGSPSFNVPSYDDGIQKGSEDEDTLRATQRPNLSLQMPGSSGATRTRSGTATFISPNVSPTGRHGSGSGINRSTSRRTVGPNGIGETNTTMFMSSDDDSDDGLFAIPLAKKAKSAGSTSKAEKVLGISEDTANAAVAAAAASASASSATATSASSKPDLRIKTSRSKMNSDSGNSRNGEVSSQPYLNERPVPPSASSNHWSTDSPEEAANFNNRRESFASDVWANRPPAEALVEHLDEFFPNVDLDQPMDVEEGQPRTESITSSDANTLSTKESSLDVSRSVTPLSSADEADTLGSSGTFQGGRASFESTAQRNLRRSGGLGRTKSIREVVKGAYAVDKHASVMSMQSIREAEPAPVQNPMLNRISTLRVGGGDIVRRKSTKMFGARIEQIKPNRGSRLINLETIPQDMLPGAQSADNGTPERQPTFKWMKGQLIGKGTFGRVYLGMNTTTGELLAVKQVEVNPKTQNADPSKIREMVKALDQEIDTMQHLDHMNIVQYLGCERKEFSISIFLEYISGGSIGSCLRKHGKFEESVVSSLTRQTLCGLSYLHHEHILHRDLKADNILLDLDGTAKISDFGISKRAAAGAYNNDVTNSMQGSVFWMAPEVIRAQSQALNVTDPGNLDTTQAMSQGYSAKVDIWALGCVVLEMFAGRRPWSKEEAIGAIYKLGSLNQAPPIPEDVSTVISPAALSFMYDCFTIDPVERPEADTLLRSPFCFSNPQYNFLDTELYAKIRGAF